MTENTTGIADLTIEETGWKRLDGNSMQWVGLLDHGGCDVMRVQARRRSDDGEEVLLIRNASLDGDEDPADEEVLDAAFESGFSSLCELSRPAVVVLHSVLGTWLRAAGH